MSIATFGWKDGKLILLMNRENWESVSRKIKPAAWDADGQILGAWFEDEDNNVGTWCGCSKNGRVSFLVETTSKDFKISSITGSEILPVEFLKGNMSPKEFANLLAKMEEDLKDYGKDIVYNLIVADITSKSMFYIGKDLPDDSYVEIIEVANGVHTLSAEDGLDCDISPWDIRLKNLFIEMIGEFGNEHLPPINEIPAKFMYDPEVFSEFHADDFPGDMNNNEMDHYGTTSTTALVVKLSGQILFYERYLKDGEWKDHDFTFNMQ